MRPRLDLAQTLTAANRGIAQQRALLMEPAPPSPTDLNKAMLDAVSLFERLGMNYALCGGIAAMYYGRARFTDDLDFVAEFLYESTLQQNPDVVAAHNFDSTCSYKLYHNSGVEVDLLYDELAFDMIERARDAELAGRRVKIVDPNDLVAMKLRAARPQDDYDVSEMINAAVVDEATVRSRVNDEEFARFLSIKSRS